jgi:hypothetical protein
MLALRAAVTARGYSYVGRTVESVTSLSTVCVRTFSTEAPTFDPSLSTIHTCCPCSNGPRVITLSKTPSSVAGFFRTSTQIASVSPKSACSLSLSSIFGFFITTQVRYVSKTKSPLALLASVSAPTNESAYRVSTSSRGCVTCGLGLSRFSTRYRNQTMKQFASRMSRPAKPG